MEIMRPRGETSWTRIWNLTGKHHTSEERPKSNIAPTNRAKETRRRQSGVPFRLEWGEGTHLSVPDGLALEYGIRKTTRTLYIESFPRDDISSKSSRELSSAKI